MRGVMERNKKIILVCGILLLVIIGYTVLAAGPSVFLPALMNGGPSYTLTPDPCKPVPYPMPTPIGCPTATSSPAPLPYPIPPTIEPSQTPQVTITPEPHNNNIYLPIIEVRSE
jgi:hypothetical protein